MACLQSTYVMPALFLWEHYTLAGLHTCNLSDCLDTGDTPNRISNILKQSNVLGAIRNQFGSEGYRRKIRCFQRFPYGAFRREELKLKANNLEGHSSRRGTEALLSLVVSKCFPTFDYAIFALLGIPLTRLYSIQWPVPFPCR